jgi:hypothetical protein
MFRRNFDHCRARDFPEIAKLSHFNIHPFRCEKMAIALHHKVQLAVEEHDFESSCAVNTCDIFV